MLDGEKKMRSLILFTLILLATSGCTDSTVVKVRVIDIVPVKYVESFWHRTTAYTVLERLDTGERVWMSGNNWGKTGEVFGVAVGRFGM